jgi:hypothetical protein
MRSVTILLSFMVILVFANYASALATAYDQWAGANGVAWDLSASNWNCNNPAGSHILPTATDLKNVAGNGGALNYKVGFKTPTSAPLMTSGTMYADILVVGGGSLATPGYLTDGGTNINVSQYITLAAAATDFGLMTVNSGVINTGYQMNNESFFVSQLGWGKLVINDGTINVGATHWLGTVAPYTQDFSKTVFGAFTLAQSAGSIGNAYLNGGVINADTFAVGAGTGHLYVDGGQLVLNGNVTTAINALIGTTITTDIVGGSVVVDYGTINPGKTTVFATPEPATVCLLGLGAMALVRRNKK